MKADTRADEKNLFPEMIKMLVTIIEGKGTYIKGHAERVAVNCVRFARMLQLPRQSIDTLYLAALLHDIGMVFTPLEIIQKPGKLNEHEMAAIKEHPGAGEKMLSGVSMLRRVIPAIRHHHEFFDGSGYPDRLQGNEIPLESRIVCIVDSYEAMTAFRAYRPALSTDAAMAELQKNADKLFDGRLVTGFINFIKSTPSVPLGVKDEEQKMSVREKLIDIIQKFTKGEIDLPVLPRVVEEVENSITKPDATLDDLSRIIEKDAAISIKLIVVANSPVYRGMEKVQTARHAILRLGVKETRNIVLEIARRSIYATRHEQFKTLMETLWLHALACAYCSKSIAQNFTDLDPDKLFFMGLVHDVGKSLLVRALTEVYSESSEVSMPGIISSIQEMHTGFSAALLTRWDFTMDFIKVAELHEGPRFFASAKKEVLVVSLANSITRTIGYSVFSEEQMKLGELDSARLLHIAPGKLVSICDEVQDIMQASRELFS